MKEKEESDKADLKLNIHKAQTMASGPITSWQIDGETLETVADFIFLGSKITADGDCSHNKGSHRYEKPKHHNEEQPTLAAMRESPHTETKIQHNQK